MADEQKATLQAILDEMTEIVYDGDAPSINDIAAAALADPVNMGRCNARIVDLLHGYNIGLLEADSARTPQRNQT